MKDLEKFELEKINGGASFAYRVGQAIRLALAGGNVEVLAYQMAEETMYEALAEAGLD